MQVSLFIIGEEASRSSRDIYDSLDSDLEAASKRSGAAAVEWIQCMKTSSNCAQLRGRWMRRSQRTTVAVLEQLEHMQVGRRGQGR